MDCHKKNTCFCLQDDSSFILQFKVLISSHQLNLCKTHCFEFLLYDFSLLNYVIKLSKNQVDLNFVFLFHVFVLIIIRDAKQKYRSFKLALQKLEHPIIPHLFICKQNTYLGIFIFHYLKILTCLFLKLLNFLISNEHQTCSQQHCFISCCLLLAHIPASFSPNLV